MANNDKELFSKKIKVRDNKFYFFDIKKSVNGNLYLLISESKKTKEGKYEHNRVMVYNEDIDDFVVSLDEVMREFRELEKNI
jgi:hypothetical protein